MRWLVVVLGAIGTISAAAAAAAALATPLPVSNLFTKKGHPSPLRARVPYQADRSFPTGLRFTLPTGTWHGAQWRTGARQGPIGQRTPPFYGWASVGQGPANTGAGPRGVITIEMKWARSRSVDATVQRLRSRGGGATYGPTSTASVGGFTGSQFDATIVGHEHAFIPFSRTSSAASYYEDAAYFGKGEHVRVIVFNVGRRGVVVYIENADLPLDQFPAFLDRAGAFLQALKFSK
jgi:hypothetical protein